MSSGPPMMVGEAVMVHHPHDSPNISHHHVPMSHPQNVEMHHQHLAASSRPMCGSMQETVHSNQIHPGENVISQLGNSAMVTNVNSSGMVVQGQLQVQPQQQRVVLNNQLGDQNSPGRPNIQMIPFGMNNPQRQNVPSKAQGPQFYNNQYSQLQQFEHNKYVKPYMQPMGGGQVINGYKPHVVMNPHNPPMVSSLQKIQWQNKMQQGQGQVIMSMQNTQASQSSPNVYERVPPLHHSSLTTIWQDEIKKKRSKLEKMDKKRPFNIVDCQLTAHAPCPNIDVRQIPPENARPVGVEQTSQNSQATCSPSFLEDPSGYLAQQTALLNSTISRQTGM